MVKRGEDVCFGKGLSSSMVQICLFGKLNSGWRLPGSAPSETCGDLLFSYFSLVEMGNRGIERGGSKSLGTCEPAHPFFYSLAR